MGSSENIIRAAIMASGNGSNAENILRHAAKFPGKIKISLVICDRPGAQVITRAHNHSIPCAVIPRDGNKSQQEEKIMMALRAAQTNWIFLAGYMAILSPAFIAAYRGRIVNIHPSLLPEFPGKDGYGDAFRANVPQSGVTLHYVDEGIDTGPVIAQKKFDRLSDDTIDSFRARGLELEYELYREFIDDLIKREAA